MTDTNSKAINNGQNELMISVVCGAIGFFVFGLFLGIASLTSGLAAKKLGHPLAWVGIIMGSIDLAGWAIAMIMMVLS